MGNRIWVFHSTGVKWSTTILARIVLQLKPVGRRSRKVGRIYGWRWGVVSLLPYKVTWSMGDIISWADYSRKQHRAWKTPPSCGYSTFYPGKLSHFFTRLLVSRHSINLGRAIVLLCAVVLQGGKQLLLWEGTQMQWLLCLPATRRYSKRR